MPRHLHVDPFCGAAGDMLLAGLLALGAPLDPLHQALASTRFPGVAAARLEVEGVERHGVRGLRVRVVAEPPPGGALEYPRVREILGRARVADRVRLRALAALDAAARAEADALGGDPAAVRFRELGGFDTVADLLGVALGLELLEIDSVTCGPLPLAAGAIAWDGGRIPAPAPATLELLKGLPVVGCDSGFESVTPTGAALLRTLARAFGPAPAMTLEGSGVGCGTREAPDRPNCLRLVVGRETAGGAGERLLVLEATLDDLTAELLATLIDACLRAGALDAWLTPALMKKGRPGHLVSALCRDEAAGAVEETLFRHSSTLGVRRVRVDRTALARTWETVTTPWGPVRVKVGHLGGRPVNRAPEFEDCRRLADQAGVPLKEVYAAALAAPARG
ncbi:MAG: nickel pincer cofactor biosynthesis protein LarC [Deferrisomatales bacterium]